MISERHFRGATKKELAKAWEHCYNSYIVDFGINKVYKSIMSQEEKIAKLKCDLWIKGHAHLKAIIEVEEARLAEMIKKNKPNKKNRKFEEDLAVIQKYNGFPIPPKTTSVRMFFTYVKLMEEEAEKIAKENAQKDRK